MAKNKRPKWPALKFLPESNQPPFEFNLHCLGFGQELDYFWFLQKWDGGIPLKDAFPVHYQGRRMVGRVRSFYSTREVATTILSSWDLLPRGAVPIGDIDIEGWEFDRPTLLTFCRGEKTFNKLFFYDNPHDCGPIDPDDPTNLIPLANSLSVFLNSLNGYNELYYRTFFALRSSPEELSTIMEAIEASGGEEFSEAYFTPGKECNTWFSTWEEQNAQITVAHSVKKISEVPVPTEVTGKSQCLLAIDAPHWDQTAAQRAVKQALKSVPAFKGAKKVGQTAAEIEPYWRKR